MLRLTSTDFRLMPWKNGGGSTLELYCLKDDDDDILFRLSRAMVKQDGPFSLFPGIERTLLVLTGEGLSLDVAGEMVELRPNDPPFSFAGEIPIHCDLLEGPVEDFNVMLDRSYGSAQVTLLHGPKQLQTTEQMFVYRPSKNELWILKDEMVTTDFAKDELVIEVRVSWS